MVQRQAIRDHLQTSRVWAVLGKRSMSRIITLVDTLAPASLHTSAAAHSRAYPDDRAPPPARRLHGDGHESQVEGHTGSYARKGAREASGDTEATT